jgi:predicted TIM-barrel fold metal-dependent hydrolase
MKTDKPSRRGFLASAAVPALLPAGGMAQSTEKPEVAPRIYLDQYQPKSMLVVPQTRVERARFPLIDVHTHVSVVFGDPEFGFTMPPGRSAPDKAQAIERLAQTVRSMDTLNIKTLVNLTGGTGDVLKRNIAELQVKHKGRYLVCTEPSYERYADPNYPQWQAQEIERAKAAGAVGIKVLKSLGLVLREKITSGPLVKIDDKRFDPMWETAGHLGMPIFIHIADPDAFFTPTDKFNERYEELQQHPDWSFYGKDYPTKKELLEQRNRIVERHPKTVFVGLHVANHPENLDDVSGWLRKYPNLHCEFAARISELGRQPRRSQKFFDEFQDRIMFGTDAQGVNQGLYYPYFRFLETLDEHFDYASGPIPRQGRWKISGVGLVDGILKKVYHNNAARLLGLNSLPE